MKTLLSIVLLVTSFNASADAWSGAMIGIGKAGQDYGDRLNEERRAERQQQYEIEREQRIAAERQYQREQQAEYDRQDQLAKQREAEILYLDKQIAILNMHHKDWREVTNSSEYQEWGGKLPEDTRRLLSKSMDGELMSSAITAFKEYKKQNKKQSAKKGVHYEKF